MVSKTDRTGHTRTQAIALPRPWLDRFAIALAALSPTVLATSWAAERLAAHFFVELIVAAVGIPVLVVLAWGPRHPTRPPSMHGKCDRPQRRLRLAAQIGAGFGIWTLVAGVVSPQPALSFFGRLGAANGALLVLAFLGAWAIGVALRVTTRPLLELTLVAVATINAIVAIGQMLFVLGEYERPAGLFGNPLYAATLMAAAAWPALHRLAGDWRIWGPVIVVLAGGVQASGSRFGLVVLIVQLLAALAIAPRRRVAALAGVLACCALGAVLLGPTNERTISTSRILLAQGGELVSRVELWKASGQAIADRPFSGAGPARTLAATNPHRSLEAARAGDADTNFLDAHNIVIEYTVTTGLVGGALLSAFLVVAIAQAGWRSPLAGFAIGVLTMTLIQPVHATMTPLALLALGAAAVRPARQPVRPPARAILVTTSVALVIATCFAYGSFALSSQTASFKQAGDLLETSRRFLPFWYEPLHVTAWVTSALPSANPQAVDATLYWRQRAAEQEPDHYELWNWLAADEVEFGRLESAERHFQRALVENPWSIQTLNGLGDLYRDTGRSDDARRAYERSLLVVPDQPEVRTSLDQLP